MRLTWMFGIAACGPDPGGTTVVFDFEQPLVGWHVEGDLDEQPTRSKRAGFRRHGRSFVGTAEAKAGYDDARTGTLTSGAFLLDRPYALLRVGGGRDAKRLRVALRRASDGKVLGKATGPGAEAMHTVIWNLEKHVGEYAYLEILDRSKKAWGHINVDWLRLVDG